MYGRNQHNIVIILLLKIIKGKKRKKLGGRKKRNNQPSAFPTKEKCQSPQTTWLSFPREHVSSAVGVQDLEFWLLPSVWEKSLESQEAAQKRITWGFFWPELKVWSERTSQSQLAPLYCCAESPKALGSQVNEPALAFWWWLPPLQWEAEIVDWQQSFFFFSVRPHSTACGTLVPWPRIEPTLPALGGRVLAHWGSPGTIIFYLWLGMGRPGFQSLLCYWVTLGRSFLLSGSFLIFKASRLLGHFLGLLWETHHVGSQYHTGLATRPLWIQPALDSIPALYLVGCVMLGKLLHLPEPLFHSPVNQEKHYPYHTIVQSSNRNLLNVRWLTVCV